MSEALPSTWDGLSPSVAGAADALCQRFETAWQATGRRPRLEQYLAEADEPVRPLLLRELLGLELDYRCQLGEEPTPAEYLARFPNAAAVIHAVFAGTADREQRHAGSPLATQSFAATVEPSASAPAPSRGPRFRVLRPHARGGLGQVFVARDEELGREVALKEIQEEHADDPGSRTRFLFEATVTASLEHPGVVPVYGLGASADGRPFYAMRFIRGRTLRAAAQSRRQKQAAGEETSLELAALLHAFVVVCNTVGYAHARGVIHRDLKGANVLLGDFGEVVVLDWGLAKRVGRPEEEVPPAADLFGQPDLTTPGQALGTPAYMAPEQADGRLERIDHRTDIYGLGAILYEILTGQPPFSGPTVQEVLRQVRDQEPAPPRRLCPDVAEGLEAVCLKALAKRPEDRQATAKEIADQVQQWQESERRQAEEALRASEARYRLLVDSIPQSVWTATPDGMLDYINQRGSDFHGVPREEASGGVWQQLVHPDDLPRCLERWTQCLQTGAIYEVEFRLKGADGGYRWFLARAVPVRDDAGRIISWFGTNTDIDTRKHVEETLVRTEAELARCRQELADLRARGGPR